MYAEDCVVEWPQSGERIRGKENLLALREAYPARVEFELRRVIGRRDLGVSEYGIRYDGKPVNVVSIVEFGDGKVIRETHYFADPFPPPEWRAQWVERMEVVWCSGSRDPVGGRGRRSHDQGDGPRGAAHPARPVLAPIGSRR